MRLFFAFVAGVASMMSVTASADLAVDHSGNLFLTAPNDNSILKFSPNGTKSTFASGVEGALAFDAAGNLFVGVSDATGTIFKFAPDGTKSTFAAGIGNPVSLTFDPAGNLYAYDMESGSIFKFTPNGDKSTFAKGTKPPGQMFASSVAIACNRAGNLFAADSESDTIFKFAPDGARTTFASKIKATNLAVDKANNLLAANFWSKDILKFSPDGAKTTLKTALNAPEGLAVDSAGNLFVYDGPDTIFKFAPNGTKSTFARNRPEPVAVASEGGPEAEPGADSSAGLPEKFAKGYLIAQSTISPDKKFAVIYPNEAMAEAASEKELKNYLVALQPFAIIRPLDTTRPYFEHESHGGLSAEWSDDSSIGLIILDSKWGPGDVLLVEFHNGKLSRMTNISRKVRDLLMPNWRKAKAERYNDYNEFVFIEDASFKLDGTNRVIIEAEADTTPNDLGLSERAWRGYIAAIWDIPQAKLTSTKVSGQRRKKREQEPDEAGMYHARGENKKNESDFEGAIADYTRAIELYPKYSEAYRERGIAKAKKKEPDLDGAIVDLDHAIKLDPNDAVAYAGRADVQGKRKQYDPAIKDIRKAIDLDLVKGPYYVALAWYDLLNRRPQQAIEASLKALEWSPSDTVTIKANLAHAYLLDNQFDKAKAIYLQNKDGKLDNERTFRQAVLDDFKELQDAGITHPDMEKIKALLTTNQEGI
jgi:tetratricopeptide (TPR) repeat protein